MSIRVDSSPLIAGTVVVGDPGLGVLAELVPSTGEHGPGIAYTWLGPAEAGKEVRVLITQWPEVGSLFVWEDTSFEYNGPGGTAYAQLYVEGQPVDTPQTVTVTVGTTVTLGTPTTDTITSSGFNVAVDLAGSGSGTIRFAVYPAGTGPYTYTIGSGWSGSPVYTDSETAPTPPATHVFAPDVSGLSASTSYDVICAWKDGATVVYSAVATQTTAAAEISVRAIILSGGSLAILPTGQEGTGKKPIVLLDGELRERVVDEGAPIVFDGGDLRTIQSGEFLVI